MFSHLYQKGLYYDKEPVHNHDPGSLTYIHPVKDELNITFYQYTL